MPKIDFPIKHISGNLIFNKNKECWAYYKIDGFSYDYLEEDSKTIPYGQQLAFLTNVALDVHLLVLPNPTDISNIIDRTIEEMKLRDYPLRDNGIKYFEQQKKVLLKEKELNETAEYHYYIGVQLDPSKNRYKSVNTGINFLSNIKTFFNGLNSPLYQAIGLYPNSDILESEIEAFHRQAEIIENSIADAFTSRVKRISTIEIAFVIEKTFSTRNNASDIRIRKQFEVGNRVVGANKKGIQYSAIRTQENDFYDLQNVSVDEVSPKTLLLSRITEDDEFENLYAQYFVISEMENVYFHPSSEWLYHVQLSLRFPVTISIRANFQDNEIIKKKLGNAKLGYDDQRKEANKGGQHMDSADASARSGTLSMEQYFKESGLPAFSTSFVFKITGENEDQLKQRATALRNELSKKGIKIVSPYGEQLQCMYETIIGNRKMTDDYRMELAPTVLAGLMFGATTNIGDNRGFYLGNTKRFSKPVFIKPDLAAKAFDGLGNVVDSISVLVAGMTGKGKSVFMNLYSYLSVLTGSQGLIIDPKGDRKDWVKGLPYIPENYINVWTLGASMEDAGVLDPFRTAHDLEDGKDMCMEILSYLADVNLNDIGYTHLSEAVEKACEKEDVCAGLVIEELEKMHESGKDTMGQDSLKALDSLLSIFRTIRRNKLSALLIGEVGQEYRPLNPDIPLQVLMIENLSLPDTPEAIEKPNAKEKISIAVMLSITGWTKQFMLRGDRSQHKFILQDEASTIDQTNIGRQLMDFIVRKGRFYNTTLLKGSQNASDHKGDVANLGMKFSFCLQNADEAIQMLRYLNLPQTQDNIEALQKLPRGTAMFQDIFGRSAIIQINPVFQQVLDAFDSSTATKEERERERATQF
ncbi:hypothetical protein ABD87_14740 [Lysinibacillus sphaericus]|uniref:ATP-binding protein n=1 Tax=Lysinibacillus sphaericus TaxID=1421 RepID=UPI0018CC7E7A|nr:ATP-binding protein [Lysinibacillus sphaericus]MBG9730756.1 hypothetical protein [Lysinibacillus sphaericus]